jgi:glycosyltransferase involved in cell wall biosynthesis
MLNSTREYRLGSGFTTNPPGLPGVNDTLAEERPIEGIQAGIARQRPRPTISVVVPARDEHESLPTLVERLRTVIARNGLAVAEIVLIDDGSADRSWPVMQELAARHLELRAIRLRRNFGKATALMVGVGRTTGDIIVTMDADLQDDPDELPRFVAAIEAGHDLVSGWKKERHDPLSKTLPSWLFNRLRPG